MLILALLSLTTLTTALNLPQGCVWDYDHPYFGNVSCTLTRSKLFKVPGDVNSVTVWVRGGNGGDSLEYGPGGLGGSIAARFKVKNGTVIDIDVAGNGASGVSGGQGGYGDGGNAGVTSYPGGFAGAGGGATNVFVNGKSYLTAGGGGGGSALMSHAGNGGIGEAFGGNGELEFGHESDWPTTSVATGGRQNEGGLGCVGHNEGANGINAVDEKGAHGPVSSFYAGGGGGAGIYGGGSGCAGGLANGSGGGGSSGSRLNFLERYKVDFTVLPEELYPLTFDPMAVIYFNATRTRNPGLRVVTTFDKPRPIRSDREIFGQ